MVAALLRGLNFPQASLYRSFRCLSFLLRNRPASPRRLQHLQATNEALVRTMTRTKDDPFAAFPELAPYQLFAGDGHWHAAAAHDPRDHKGIKHATALLPGINYADRNGPQFDDCPIIVFPYMILLWHPGAHETGRPQFL